MKVLYVCPSPTMYGDNIALMSIMPTLMKKGVEPLFLVQREGDFTKYLQCNGYKYIVSEFTYNHIYNLSNPIRSFIKRLIKGAIRNLSTRQYIRQALHLFQDFKPQIIHTNNSANDFGLKLAKILEIPHVWHLREYMDLDHNNGYFPSKRAFEKKLDHPLNTCVCITENVSRHFNTNYSKLVIYDGIIKSSENVFSVSSKEDILLYVGRLLETKGVYDIVKVFAKITDSFPTYTLLFLGDGDKDAKEQLSQLTKNLNITERVKFLGYKTNVDEYMKRAKAIIVSSRFEAFGLITAEAMNNGCMVLGRNTAGTKEQFDNGVSFTGGEIAMRYETISELESSLRKALDMSPDEYNDLVTRAHDTAAHFYNVERSALDIYSLYYRLLDR